MQTKLALAALLSLLTIVTAKAYAFECEMRLPASDLKVWGYHQSLKTNDVVFRGIVQTVNPLENSDGSNSRRYTVTYRVLAKYKGLIEDQVDGVKVVSASDRHTVGKDEIVIANLGRSGFGANECEGEDANRDYPDEAPEAFLIYAARVARLKQIISRSGHEALQELAPLLEQYKDRTELEVLYTQILEQDLDVTSRSIYRAKRGGLRYDLGLYEKALEDLSGLENYARRLTGVDIEGLVIKSNVALKRTSDLEKPQRAGASDFSRQNLRGMKWSNSEFQQAIFTHADLQETVLREAKLTHAVFEEAYLEHADLSFISAYQTNFARADLHAANLSSADVRAANFWGANLKEAILAGAKYDERTIWPTGFDPVAAGAIDCTIRDLKNPPCD